MTVFARAVSLAVAALFATSCGGGAETSALEQGAPLPLRESARLACGDSGRTQARVRAVEPAAAGRARRLAYSAAASAWPCEALLLPAGGGYAVQLRVAAPLGGGRGEPSEWCAEIRPPGLESGTTVVAEFQVEPGSAEQERLRDRLRSGRDCVPVPARVVGLD